MRFDHASGYNPPDEIITARLAADPHSGIMDKDTAYRLYMEPRKSFFWRRLWFLVSCIPRYLITGSVEVP